jgi:[ribosomal protein S5]-alanine N-acetyltransferase
VKAIKKHIWCGLRKKRNDMSIILETKRLVLKTPTLDNIDELYLLQSDPDVMKYIGSGVRTKEVVIDATESAIKHYKDHGFSMGSLYEKKTGHFIGQAGLLYLAYNDKQPDIEIGYRLHKRYWGRGFATEIGKALVTWGFQHLAIDHLIAVINPENSKSEAVLKKIGMHYVGKINAYNTEVMKFEIHKNE